MDFSAGPEFRNDAHHAVLWSRESYSGDLRLDYEYTRLDEEIRGVTILYLQATGDGSEETPKEISTWAHRRKVPAMRMYFNHMNTYHISYAAYGMKNTDPEEDYIRARRYMPTLGKGLQGTGLKPDYLRVRLFETDVPYHVTVIKRGQDLFMRVRDSRDKGHEQIFHWHNDALPPITEGRIGLRHMYTRAARYKNFRISVPATASANDVQKGVNKVRQRRRRVAAE